MSFSFLGGGCVGVAFLPVGAGCGTAVCGAATGPARAVVSATTGELGGALGGGSGRGAGGGCNTTADGSASGSGGGAAIAAGVGGCAAGGPGRRTSHTPPAVVASNRIPAPAASHASHAFDGGGG